MKQYPYIGKFQHTVKLFYAPNKFELLEIGNGLSRHESNYTNITHEYLQKTWGLVESKEHADYISEQCKSVGIISSDTWRCEYGYFSISLNELLFWGDESHASSKGKKQITIPLPPKAECKTPVFHADEIRVINQFGETMTYVNTSLEGLPEAGHNLVFAASECKEWPCVNDEVTWGNKVCSGIIKAIDGNLAWIKNEHGNYVTEYIDKLQKPKTPEEALRDDIIELTLSHMENKSHPIEANAYYLFSELLTKYNITPKD